MSCEYCTPVIDRGGDPVIPWLPWDGEDSDMSLTLDEGGEWFIAYYTWPPKLAGPVRYCPMCGGELKSGAE